MRLVLFLVRVVELLWQMNLLAAVFAAWRL